MKQIRVVWGDITKLPCEGFVSLAHKIPLGDVEPAGNVAELAGSALMEEFKELGSFDVGDAKITKGYNLQAKYIIHTLPFDRQEANEKFESRLNKCFIKILQLAKENGVKSLAIPTIKVGLTKQTLSESIGVAVQSVYEWIKKNRSNMEIIFCANTKEEFELYQIFYPICSWENERKYENVVMDIIEHIGDTRALNTRKKALAVIKDMLARAMETNQEKVIQAYRRLEYEIDTATDTEYELLYKQCQKVLDDNQTATAESFEIGAIRQAFKNEMDFLTKDMLCEFFDISEAAAEKVLRGLVNMNYINIGYFEEDLIVYSILISKEDFYLIHGD